MTRDEKYRYFKALHEKPGAFVVPNPWDAGSARVLAAMGYDALATTSAGLAFSLGVVDSAANLSRAVVLENARAIVDASVLPVSADLEKGFGDSPDICAETVQLASDVGLVGGSIEDATGDAENPIFPFDLAVERVAASCDAAWDLPFFVTARAENFLHGRPDLDDTIKRLQAFSAAGADVLYAPGLPGIEAIKTVCEAVDKPVNVVMGLSGGIHRVDELAAVGVKRISVGGSFARAAMGAFIRAATEVKTHGTFGYAADAIPDATLAGYMRNKKTS